MELIDILFLLGAIQGFLLLLALIIKNRGKKNTNYFFYLLLLVICLILTAKLVSTEKTYQANPHVWYFVDLLAYSIGPLWYFTIIKSVQSKIKLSITDALCFLPAFYQVFSKAYLLTLTKEELLSSGDKEWYEIMFYVFCATVFLVNASYLYRSYLMLLSKKASVKFPPLLLKGQYAMLLVICVWALSLLANLFLYDDYLINLTLYRLAFLTLSFLTFSLAFLALLRPESFYFLTQVYDSSKAYIMQEIAKRVIREIGDNNLFLDPNFSLHELSKSIDSTPILTSKAINHYLKTNFKDLMNEFRINHFIRMAKNTDYNNLTHWALAQESGFGNKVSFYKAFKKMTGSTPKAYLDNN